MSPSRPARPLARLIAAPLLAQLACASPAPARQPERPPPSADVAIGREQDPSEMLARLAARFIEAYFEAAPVSATVLGEHRHDGRWPDLSAEALRTESRGLDEQLAAARQIPRAALSPLERVELDTLINQLELWRYAAEVEQPWRRDPLAYSYLISAGLDELIARDFAPLEHRALSLAARLEGLPALVEQARANLDDPALVRRPHAELARTQLEGLRELIEREIPARTEAAPEALRARIEAATPPALAALDELRAQLEHIIPSAAGPWRVGHEAFSRKLALTLQTPLSADELVEHARSEHARVRLDMQALAGELYAAMHGARERARLEAADGGRDAIVREVLDELGALHPEPAELRDAAEACLARLQQFVLDEQLVPLDPAERVEVIWTPPHARGVAIAGLAPSAPLDAAKPGLPSFYLVQPIPSEWSPALRESYLREYNSFMLEILSIHEAIPGHFVQLYWAERGSSLLLELFQNGAFVEGWAVYSERLMVEAGYAGAAPDPARRRPAGVSESAWMVLREDELRAKAIALHGLKFYLRTVTNAILDHQIHTADMSREQALELMVERSFQQPGEAEGKWVRAQLSSTQLSTYFVGATSWFRLRERAEARARAAGQPFDLLAFHRAALSHGAPPVDRLPELMGW